MGYVEQTVTGSNDVQQAVQSILSKCDALYIPTDNTLAASAALVGSAAQTAKIPVFWGEGNCVAEGGLASLGLDYYNLGRQTGEMAVEVLEGADPAVMPIQSQSDYSYTISKSMAEEIGIEIPEHLLEFAGITVRKEASNAEYSTRRSFIGTALGNYDTGCISHLPDSGLCRPYSGGKHYNGSCHCGKADL